MSQATTKTYQLFRETLLNATSEEHKNSIIIPSKVFAGIYRYKDINLEDVLMALDNNKKTLRIDQEGELIMYEHPNFSNDYKNDWEQTNVFWNLTKPAHLQSEETLLEIIKLLK